jgi:hypothetical protein
MDRIGPSHVSHCDYRTAAAAVTLLVNRDQEGLIEVIGEAVDVARFAYFVAVMLSITVEPFGMWSTDEGRAMVRDLTLRAAAAEQGAADDDGPPRGEP